MGGFMLTKSKAVFNLHNIADQVTYQQWADGNVWYDNAHHFCFDLAVKYNLPVGLVVGCLAVLSPQCEWSTNKLAVESILAIGQSFHQVFPKNIKKAKAIVEDKIAPIVIMGGGRYGQKVRSFYDNILHPYSSPLVTVDTHAIRAAFGGYSVTKKQLRWVFESKIGYSTVQSAYQEVAIDRNLQPHRLQAAIWLYVKANKSFK
jgi:hypothetical protein